MADTLRNFAGVVLLTALAVAPLHYGSTRLLPWQTLIALAATGGIFWILSGALRGAWPLPPPLACVALALIGLSVLAWLFFLSPPETPAFTLAHAERIAKRWPHSVMPREFGLTMIWTIVALVAFCALCDLAHGPAWRRSIALVILTTGAAVALLGLVQNATRARGIYWDASHRLPGFFFGPFFHHTSAGAYLNTVWPLGFSLALAGLAGRARGISHRTLVFFSLAAGALVIAAHAGHISRLPQVVAALMIAVSFTWCGLWRALANIRGLRAVVLMAAVLLTAAVFSMGATRLGAIAERWNQLDWSKLRGGGAAVTTAPASEWRKLMRDDLFVPSSHRDYPLGDRGAAYATAAAAISARPWFGWGPGGWTAAAAAHSADPFIRTFYLFVQFTHQDLLQACVEWGLIGGLGWTILLAGAVGTAVWRLRTTPSNDFIGAGSAIALAAVLLQSLIDFPLQIPAIQFNALALAALAWSVPAARHNLPVLADSVLPTHERAQSY